MITENTAVKVLNYGTSDIGLKGQNREYLLDGSRGVPTTRMIPFSDIEYINARCPVFRTGALQFEETMQETVYNALGLTSWQESVLFDSEIQRIIMNADMAGLQRFLDVKDVFTIERIRGHMVALSQAPECDVSTRVIDLIETRCDEINRGIRNTKISLRKTGELIKSDADPRIATLEEQLAQMQQQMEKLLSTRAATKKKPATTTKASQ